MTLIVRVFCRKFSTGKEIPAGCRFEAFGKEEKILGKKKIRP
jgi:hypothetical protein